MNSSEIMKNRFVQTLTRNDFRNFSKQDCEEIILQFAKAIEEVYGIKAYFEESFKNYTLYISPKTRWKKKSIFSVHIDANASDLFFDRSSYCINANTLPDILEKISTGSYFRYVIKSCFEEEKEPSSITFCSKEFNRFFEIKEVISPETRKFIFFPIKKQGDNITFSFVTDDTQIVIDDKFFMPEIVMIENAELFVTDFSFKTDSLSSTKKITITGKILKIRGQND